jgi:hypothetical protein
MGTPPITPSNVNGPNPVPVKEPGGIVTAKVPIWRVTGSAAGLIPFLALPKVRGLVGFTDFLTLTQGYHTAFAIEPHPPNKAKLLKQRDRCGADL